MNPLEPMPERQSRADMIAMVSSTVGSSGCAIEERRARGDDERSSGCRDSVPYRFSVIAAADGPQELLWRRNHLVCTCPKKVGACRPSSRLGGLSYEMYRYCWIAAHLEQYGNRLPNLPLCPVLDFFAYIRPLDGEGNEPAIPTCNRVFRSRAVDA